MSLQTRTACYYAGIFIVCSLLIVLMLSQYQIHLDEERMCDTLEVYADLLHQHRIQGEPPDRNLHITRTNLHGTVLYDSQHLPVTMQGKEWRQAQTDGEGYAIKHEGSLSYFYYVKQYDTEYIRIGKCFYHNNEIYESAYWPMLLTLLFFLLATLVYYMVNRQTHLTISALKGLIHKADNNIHYHFPAGDLREISEYITHTHHRLHRTQNLLEMERDKLMAHLKLSKRGLAIFSPQRKEILSNELFIQYINLISDKKRSYSETIFDMPEFEEFVEFLDTFQCADLPNCDTKTLQISRKEVTLLANCILFPDQSFEIILDDITQQEQQTILKKQLTQNISHELKTPVSSIQGFTETLLNNPDMEEEKKRFYIERCYTQAMRLNYLLRDISMLNKMEEASEFFAIDPLNLYTLVEDVLKDVTMELEQKHFQVDVKLNDPLPIQGNYSLLYSIFRNLIDNSLLYAGTDIHLLISCYRNDKEFYYFSFADDGVGVSEEHLSRLFDRFYRVDKGRSRKLGGTGLGLSIVKNAIRFHHGRISAKTHQGGGLEFLFTLRKT